MDDLLDGFTDSDNNKASSFSPNLEQVLDSNDEDDKGDLDETTVDWEGLDDLEESVPLEGKMEDLDVPEELQASVSPVPTETPKTMSNELLPQFRNP